MGGADVIRQALEAGLVDKLSIIVAPVTLGAAPDVLRASASEDVERLLQVALEHPPPEESHGRVEEPSLALPSPVEDEVEVAAVAVAWLDCDVPGAAGWKTFESWVVPTTRLSDHA